MSSTYEQPHWDLFSSTVYVSAGAGGAVPSEWVLKNGIAGAPPGLPTTLLDRHRLRSICQNPKTPALFGYLSVMAWGVQGGNGRGKSNVQTAWAEHARLEKRLNALRGGGLARSEAYNLFAGDNRIKGLGPSFWTKLLYFFSPTTNFYIMDQWTGKSVNLLNGHQLVRLDDTGANKSGNYQAYCEEIDEMARLLNLPGDNVEEMLMSSRGKVWRKHVKENCDYNPARLRQIYPHIPKRGF